MVDAVPVKPQRRLGGPFAVSKAGWPTWIHALRRAGKLTREILYCPIVDDTRYVQSCNHPAYRQILGLYNSIINVPKKPPLENSTSLIQSKLQQTPSLRNAMLAITT